MAQVVFSQSGSTQIRVTGGASSGTLSGTRWITGFGFKSTATVKNNVIRMTDLTSGGTVLVTGTSLSYDTAQVNLPQPVKADGIRLTCPANIQGVIYCQVGK